jgi:putative oxidoreductase
VAIGDRFPQLRALRHRVWHRISALRSVVVSMCPIILGGTFLLAGVSKIVHPYDFMASVYEYGLVGETTGYWIAWVLPWIEVTIGISLASGVLERGAALTACILCMVFLYAKIAAVPEERVLGCGCLITGGQTFDIGGEGQFGVWDVLMTVGVLALSLTVFACCGGRVVGAKSKKPSVGAISGGVEC